MYTFLNQRYGLKHIIIENASAVLKAVERYAGVDNDVAVFAKILHNEIDEEFVLVQRQLKEAVVDLLRYRGVIGGWILEEREIRGERVFF